MSSDPGNPYAAPVTAATAHVPDEQNNPYPACPKCQAKNAKKVGYTWWGGVLGPALFKVVKCQNCKTSFSGKNGKLLGGTIAIYMVVGLALAVILGFMIGLLGA